jgi:hypothetical protein
MLDEHKTLRRYWVDAVYTTCHVEEPDFSSGFHEKDVL